jgi:hypothetical protein
MVRSLFGLCAVVLLIGASARAATEESPTRCTAKLPDGTTVGLLGLRCYSISVPEGFEGDRWQWWKPDGVSLSPAPDTATTRTSESDSYVFAVHLRCPSDCSCVAVGPWRKDINPRPSRHKGPAWREQDDLRLFSLRFARNQKTADIRLGVATGDWALVQEWTFWKNATPDSASFGSAEEVILRCPEQQRGDVVAEVTHGFAEEATRLVIFDSDGVPHVSTRETGGEGGGLVRYIHRFANLRTGDIKRLEFQKRPYDYWITFRNVSLRPGQKTQPAVEIEQTRAGLTGAPLPHFNVAKIDAATEKAKSKRILLCFWDVGQRPSRSCIQQLVKMQSVLEAKQVSIILVHLSSPGDNPPEEWLERNRIPLLTETLGEGRVQARQIWGVKVLPWLILTDDRHNVTAEGFPLSELNQKLDAQAGTKQ